MRLFRTIHLGLALSMGSIFAHHVAGGEFVNLSQFIFVAVATYGVGALLSKSEMQGPSLASGIVLTQLFGHFALSTNYESSVVMYMTHLGFGLLTYFGLKHLENFARWAFDTLFAKFEEFIAIPVSQVKTYFVFVREVRCTLCREIVRFWSPATPTTSF